MAYAGPVGKTGEEHKGEPTDVAMASLADCIASMNKTAESYSHSSRCSYLRAHLSKYLQNDPSPWAKDALTHLDLIVEILIQTKYVFYYDEKNDHVTKNQSREEAIKNRGQLIAKLADRAPIVMDGLIQKAQNKDLHYLGLLYYGNQEAEMIQDPLNVFRTTRIVRNHAYNHLDEKGALLTSAAIDDTIYHRRHLRVAHKSGVFADGLIGEVLIPENPNDNTIYIAWAGTHSVGTVKADAERAAGEQSFRKNEDIIMGQIIHPIADFYQQNPKRKLKIKFVGHSLGGALAQLTFHAFQRALAPHIIDPRVEPDAAAFDKDMRTYGAKLLEPVTIPGYFENLHPDMIASMSVDVANSAGVLLPVAESSNRLSLILSAVGIRQFGHFDMVDGDPVQMTGQSTVLFDVGNNDAQVSVLKRQNDHPSSAFARVLAPLSGGFSGAVMGSALGGPPGGVIGALIMGAGATGAALYNTQAAHRQQSELTPESYALYLSSNPSHRVTIRYELQNKSGLLDMCSALLCRFDLSQNESNAKPLSICEKPQSCDVPKPKGGPAI
jgi:hypothetical protein